MVELSLNKLWEIYIRINLCKVFKKWDRFIYMKNVYKIIVKWKKVSCRIVYKVWFYLFEMIVCLYIYNIYKLCLENRFLVFLEVLIVVI